MIFLAIFSFLFLAYLANEAVVGRPFVLSDFLDEEEIFNSEEEETIPIGIDFAMLGSDSYASEWEKQLIKSLEWQQYFKQCKKDDRRIWFEEDEKREQDLLHLLQLGADDE